MAYLVEPFILCSAPPHRSIATEHALRITYLWPSVTRMAQFLCASKYLKPASSSICFAAEHPTGPLMHCGLGDVCSHANGFTGEETFILPAGLMGVGSVMMKAMMKVASPIAQSAPAGRAESLLVIPYWSFSRRAPLKRTLELLYRPVLACYAS